MGCSVRPNPQSATCWLCVRNFVCALVFSAKMWIKIIPLIWLLCVLHVMISKFDQERFINLVFR